MHIETPYDEQINRYGAQLNDTYIGYGLTGKQAKNRQIVQDQNASSSSSSVMAERNMAKASKQYKTNSWDIVSLYSEDKNKAIEMAKRCEGQVHQYPLTYPLNNIKPNHKLSKKL